jgi:hypothetical protein
VARKKEAPAKTAVRVLIFSSRGEVLLIRDASDERSPDKWLTPGEWLGGRAGTAAGLRRLVKQKLHIDVLVDRRPCDPVFDGKRHVECRILRTRPRSGRRSPVSTLSVVVLPAPLEPRSPNICPRPTSKERSSTATSLPKRFVRCSIHMAGPAGPSDAMNAVTARPDK